MKIKINILLPLLFISFLMNSCHSQKWKVINGKCKPDCNPYNPFVLSIDKIRMNHDTLYVNYCITNVSSSNTAKLLFKDHLYPSVYLYDTSLIQYYVIPQIRSINLNSDEFQKSSDISCENCIDFFKNDTRFVSLMRNESYYFVEKFTVQHLSNKKIGDTLKIYGYVYIQEYLNEHCPKLPTGSLQCLSTYKLEAY